MMRKQPAQALIYGGVVLLFVMIGAISLVPEKPSHPTPATITGISYSATRFSFYAHAEFRAADGRTGTASFPASNFSCHIGDIVDAEEIGINLRLRGGACRHVPPPTRASAPAGSARH
jgi:hypothetical protein